MGAREEAVSFSPEGRELVAGRRAIEVAECQWLVSLAEFDRSGRFAADGHVRCASWLVDRCGMGFATAKEKLRVAHELSRRPLLAAALAAGGLSYSKVRAISRIYDGDEETDRVLLKEAEVLTADQLENVVRHWQRLREQDEWSDADRYLRRAVRRQRGVSGGLDRLIIDGTADEVERVMNILDASADHAWRKPVDKASAEHDSVDDADPLANPTVTQRRYDAFVDLLETAAATRPAEIDIERAAVGVTVSYETLLGTGQGRCELGSGAPICGETARRLCCDAGIHRLVTRGPSEIIDAGRKTREWSAPQRRAINARHGHRCAVRGCGRRVHQIHHAHWWEHGGPTNLNSGVPLCLAHHHLVHEGGWSITYNPADGVTTLHGPHGQTVRTMPIAPQPAPSA